MTAKQEASTSVDAAVTLLSGKQRKSQSEGVIFLSGKQKQRRVRTESVSGPKQFSTYLGRRHV